MSTMSDDARRFLAAEYLSNLADTDDDYDADRFRTEETRRAALDMLADIMRDLASEMTPADVATMHYEAASQHPIIRQTAMAEGADTGDRWGTIMQIGFTICDALTVRGETVPAELQYRPAGLPPADDLGHLDAEEMEERWPDHGDLYFAWGLGLGDNVMGSIDADDLRDYLTGPWQAAYDALTDNGEDY